MAALAARAGLGMSDAAGWALREKQGAAEKMTFEKKKKTKPGEKSWFKSVICLRGNRLGNTLLRTWAGFSAR